MQYFAGLDISVKVTSVCIVDAEGRIVRETKATPVGHCPAMAYHHAHRPKLPGLGFATSRIVHRSCRLVGKELGRRLQMITQQLMNRAQMH
ncbi:hypothetical protein ACVMIX_006625 [Rhizobium leguminosarum]